MCPRREEQRSMFDFSDEQKMVRKMVRRWVEAKLVPALDDLESEKITPYPLMRDFIDTFGVAELARASLERMEKKAAGADGSDDDGKPSRTPGMRDVAMTSIVAIEKARVSPGFAMAVGASLGLCGGAIMGKGTLAQRRRFGLPVVTGEKIGAWAITEPSAGSDAFGGMRTTAKRTDGGYLLNGQKTFISNAPHADTLLVYAKLEHGDAPMRQRPIHGFIIEREAEGLTLSKPMRKMGMWSSPTGEVFLEDCFVPVDQLLGEKEKHAAKDNARDVFHNERTGIVPMTFGIIERCLEVSINYAKEREAWGQPIADYQLIQAKLARMYVHYQNVRNLLFKNIWSAENNVRITPGEASAMKAYCAPAATECAMEAVQILGGNGYMRDFRVEQLARDAKLLQIGGGTDEIQLITCAKALLRGDMVLG
jgi:alkylation response protein AidB-like acyl-CoA dehydrogenase